MALEEETTRVEDAPSEPAARPAAACDDLLVDTVLHDNYRLLERIGEGGMNVVYKGRQVYTGKIVAVKVLREHLLSDQTHILRFKEEGRTVGLLDHQNIVRQYDFGVTADNKPYMVMDYLEGKSLAEMLQENGRLSLDDFFLIFQQVLKGLAHAHKKGVVHRDLKPSNVMIVRDDEGRSMVKIVDFGIAKAVSREESFALTRTGEIFGSPLYMSPEQCSGERVDSRSDFYSVGCMMYEALAGCPPITGETIFELIHKHVTEMPKLLSERIGAPKVPELESVIFKALEKEPEDRFRTADDFLDALDRCPRFERGAGFRGRVTAGVTRLKAFWSGRNRGRLLWRLLLVPLIILSFLLSGGVFQQLYTADQHLTEASRLEIPIAQSEKVKELLADTMNCAWGVGLNWASEEHREEFYRTFDSCDKEVKKLASMLHHHPTEREQVDDVIRTMYRLQALLVRGLAKQDAAYGGLHNDNARISLSRQVGVLHGGVDLSSKVASVKGSLEKKQSEFRAAASHCREKASLFLMLSVTLLAILAVPVLTGLRRIAQKLQERS